MNKGEKTETTNDNSFCRTVTIYPRIDAWNIRDDWWNSRRRWRQLMVVDVGKDSRMIDVPVVQYFGLTGGMSMWSQVLTLDHTVSRTWTRYCNAGADLLLMGVAWSRKSERVSWLRLPCLDCGPEKRTNGRVTGMAKSAVS